MCVTKPSLHNLIWKPLKATPFHLCAMRNTNSSFLGLIGTSLDFAFRYYSFFVCRNRRTVIIIIHLLLRLLLDDDAFADNSSSTAERHGYKLEETSIHSIFMHSTWRERSSRSLTYYEYLPNNEHPRAKGRVCDRDRRRVSCPSSPDNIRSL